MKYTAEGEHVYFVHSYWADTPTEFVTATAEYSAPLTASVQRGNVIGTQFHPEKSGDVGLGMLRAFCEMEGEHEYLPPSTSTRARPCALQATIRR